MASVQSYANSKGVKIIGDMPIYVGGHSADVWSNQKLFELGLTGAPAEVSGVPPDAFSETGERGRGCGDEGKSSPSTCWHECQLYGAVPVSLFSAHRSAVGLTAVQVVSTQVTAVRLVVPAHGAGDATL